MAKSVTLLVIAAALAGGLVFFALTSLNYQKRTDQGYDITFSESAAEVYAYNRAKFFELKEELLTRWESAHPQR